MQQRVQTDAICNIQQSWVVLHGALRVTERIIVPGEEEIAANNVNRPQSKPATELMSSVFCVVV